MHAAVVETRGGSEAAGRFSMEDEADGGLDPAPDGPRPFRGRRGRGPYARQGSNGGGRDQAREAGEPRTTYAALDLGTNNCRLLVARPAGHAFRVIDAFSRIIRLGEGISASGRISEAAIERAVSALSVCRDKGRHRHAGRARLIATEACRAAQNGDEFRARILREVGLDLEIIDRETEAALAATGAAAADRSGNRVASSCSTSAAVHPSWCSSGGARRRRAGRRRRVSRAGCRSRSASSRWPSATAATRSARDLRGDGRGGRAAHRQLRRRASRRRHPACICSAPPAP